MTHIDNMCQEKKEEEDLPALMIVSIRRYDDSWTTSKRAKRLSTVIRNNTNTRINRTTITIKQKWETSSYMDISSEISHEKN